MSENPIGIPDEELGTNRWFGQTWNAPMNDPRARIDPPVDTDCAYCRRRIEAGHRGIRIPFMTEDMDEGSVWSHYHFLCFLTSIGGAQIARQAVAANPELAGEPIPPEPAV